MEDSNKDLLKGKQLILEALNLLSKGEITFYANDRQSAKQKNKIKSIVAKITDKSAGLPEIMGFGEDELIGFMLRNTGGDVYWKLTHGEDITDDEIINDLADYLAQEAYINCARKLLNTNRLDSWICNAKIRLV